MKSQSPSEMKLRSHFEESVSSSKQEALGSRQLKERFSSQEKSPLTQVQPQQSPPSYPGTEKNTNLLIWRQGKGIMSDAKQQVLRATKRQIGFGVFCRQIFIQSLRCGVKLSFISPRIDKFSASYTPTYRIGRCCLNRRRIRPRRSSPSIRRRSYSWRP